MTVKFPVNAYLTLTEGLNKLPSWTVYPSHLKECIEKSAAIIRTGTQGCVLLSLASPPYLHCILQFCSMMLATVLNVLFPT